MSAFQMSLPRAVECRSSAISSRFSLKPRMSESKCEAANQRGGAPSGFFGMSVHCNMQTLCKHTRFRHLRASTEIHRYERVGRLEAALFRAFRDVGRSGAGCPI